MERHIVPWTIPGWMAAPIALAMVTGLLAPGLASAQEMALTEVGVSLWPEYDRPSTLVIYRITLDPAVQLPATLELEIPAVAGAPNAVAEAEAFGNLVNVTYERRVENGVAILEIEVTRPRLQIEYYDPRLEKSPEGARRFSWRWPGRHGAGTMRVEVLEPPGALDLQTQPPADTTLPGPDGLPRHLLTLGPVSRGQEVIVDVAYRRDDDRLAVEAMPAPEPGAESRGGAGVAAERPADADDGLPPLLVGAVAALVVGGVAWWFLFARDSGGAGDEATDPGGGKGGDRGEIRFCPGCGERTGNGGRFCHACGRRLR